MIDSPKFDSILLAVGGDIGDATMCSLTYLACRAEGVKG